MHTTFCNFGKFEYFDFFSVLAHITHNFEKVGFLDFVPGTCTHNFEFFAFLKIPKISKMSIF
jgi:hypothetical protein